VETWRRMRAWEDVRGGGQVEPGQARVGFRTSTSDLFGLKITSLVLSRRIVTFGTAPNEYDALGARLQPSPPGLGRCRYCTVNIRLYALQLYDMSYNWGIFLARGRTRTQYSTVCRRPSRPRASHWSDPADVATQSATIQQPGQLTKCARVSYKRILTAVSIRLYDTLAVLSALRPCVGGRLTADQWRPPHACVQWADVLVTAAAAARRPRHEGGRGVADPPRPGQAGWGCPADIAAVRSKTEDAPRPG